MRDAESAFDQVISFSEFKITEEMCRPRSAWSTLKRSTRPGRGCGEDSGQVLRIIEDVVTRGYDLRNFCRELMIHVRGAACHENSRFDAELLQLPQSEVNLWCDWPTRFRNRTFFDSLPISQKPSRT